MELGQKQKLDIFLSCILFRKPEQKSFSQEEERKIKTRKMNAPCSSLFILLIKHQGHKPCVKTTKKRFCVCVFPTVRTFLLVLYFFMSLLPLRKVFSRRGVFFHRMPGAKYFTITSFYQEQNKKYIFLLSRLSKRTMFYFMQLNTFLNFFCIFSLFFCKCSRGCRIPIASFIFLKKVKFRLVLVILDFGKNNLSLRFF